MEARTIEIAPYPEVIATGRVMACEECGGEGRIEDTGAGLSRIPFTVWMDCPICSGRGKYPQFVAFDPERLQ
jgi:DnaJ-class molecular chaperone